MGMMAQTLEFMIDICHPWGVDPWGAPVPIPGAPDWVRDPLSPHFTVIAP